jgi:hypothetical protein
MECRNHVQTFWLWLKTEILTKLREKEFSIFLS